MAGIENIIVDNLKCGGCANTIKKNLTAMDGVTSVDIDVETSRINIAYTEAVNKTDFLKKLAQLGYPEQGTTNTFQKAKSFVSCAVGKVANSNVH